MMDFEMDMDCPCRGKNLDKLLQPSILAILYRESLHGFVLIQRLGESSMLGGTEPDRAGVYRYLKKMEGSGLLSSDWELDADGSKPRRIYSITEEGKHCLKNWSAVLKNYRDSVGLLVEEIDGVLRT